MKTFYAITKIDGDKKEAHFKSVAPGENQCVIMEDNKLDEKENNGTIILPFDMLHLAPPQSAPDFIKASPFANEAGWMDVDINTLQSNKYNNVFGLGDVAALPTAKTGAAIRKQAPVVVANILGLIANNKLGDLKYNGYSSCPLVTGYGKMLLAEFGYDNVRMSDPLLSKLVDTSKEKRSMWILKKYGLPYLYWNKMMKGKM
jgi:sulfide:quinone oxidoreductase